MIFETKRLHFRDVVSSDLENIHGLHSMPETDQYNTLGIPASAVETGVLLEGWINANTETPRKRHILCIEDQQGRFIGLLGISTGKPGYRNAELWYKLHKDHWNKGYATEAVKGAVAFCFSTLQLHRVEAGCATGNIASVRVLEKAGFTREGRGRKLLPVRGEWLDNYTYSILDEDLQQ
jgi:ribosomal-protein-alanine N-acetyltransferase